MGRVVGIDLGTTNSVIAVVDVGGCRIIQNRENELQTPSVVGYHRGELLVGRPALQRLLVAPKDTIVSIKRLMGRAIGDPEVEKVKKKFLYEIVEPSDGTKDSVAVKLGEKEYSPVQISAQILAKLKKDAELALGEEITHAVITVPAYFSDKQRHATREAGLMAGLTVMQIQDEPTALAIAFGIDSREHEAKTILVYDLGGGTFDVSILMMSAGTFAKLNLEGDMWLGGDDFDQVIVDYVLKYIRNKYNIDPTKNHRFMATLKMEAQKTKEALSSSSRADLFVSGLLQDNHGNIIDIEIEITREQFEEMIKPLCEKTIAIVKKAVEGAHLTIKDIDYVLMAGNASSIPLIQNAMEQLFGKEKILRRVHPKHGVAIGAAIAAALLQGWICPKCDNNNALELTTCEKCGASVSLKDVVKKICPSCGTQNNQDAERCVHCSCPFFEIESIKQGIAPFHYGIQTAGDKFYIFIHKGDPFETPEDKRIVQTFYTRFPNQRVISVPVYGGENLERASENEKQGEVLAILPPGCPEGTPVKVKLWLDKDGAFVVDTFLEDGRDLKDLILRGGCDQKAEELIVKAEELRIKKKDILKPNENKEAEEYLERCLKKMENKDFEGARKEAENYLEFIEKAGEEADSLMVQAERMIAFGRYIVNQYGWLIEQSTYHLNNIIWELEEAINKKDHSLLESQIEKLDDEINKLMLTTDVFGKPVPSLLGVFMGMHGAIASIIQPFDLAEANRLKGELNDIEEAFKNRQFNAMDRLNAFGEKLNKRLEEMQKMHPEGIRCPSCGNLNPVGIRNCRCGEDLWILGHEKVRKTTTS